MDIVNKYLSGAIVPIIILICSIFFFIKLRGKPIIRPILLIKGMLGDKKDRATSARALVMALAGTLGVGNIVGVASAIALGGAGAVFWMWISAFLAMILKYSEVVLSLLHKRNRKNESYGGAMYYMTDFFNSCNKRGIGLIFTLIFTVFCLLNGFSMGCIIQVNSIAQAVNSVTDFSPLVIGIILAFLGVAVFFFNGKRVFKICEALIPLVSIIYIGMSIAVIISAYEKIPKIIIEIFNDAFSFKTVGAGGFGFFTSRALRYGTIRGLFSNEAGCGTSPIAHATSNAKSSVEQGILGIAEVFIDTIIVCTATAFVILLNKDIAMIYNYNPIMMVVVSLEKALGEYSKILFCISVFLFAFATIICWGYYGKECIYFLNKSKRTENIYYCFYIIFIFFGSFISLDLVWQIADLAVGVMTLMNLLILIFMSSEIKHETEQYYKKEPPKGKL